MKEYNLKAFHPKITSKTHSSSFLKVFLLFVLFLTTLVYLLGKKREKQILNPYSFSPTPIQKSSPKLTEKSPRYLLEQIEKETNPLGGTFSIYVYDLKNEKGFGLNENAVLTAASVNKIPILAALYHLAGKKEIDLEKVIVIQAKDIQDYGTGIIRYEPPGKAYSLKTLARLMMEKSDNTAAYILASQVIGLKKIQSLIDSWGMTQTDMFENVSSVKDMNLLLTKMYQGEITTPALTLEMLDFMDKSDFDDRIPAGLPENLTVYHKTGDEVGKIHDVGIIDLKDRPYYLGIFTLDMTDEKETKKAMAKISQLVYEYMKSL